MSKKVIKGWVAKGETPGQLFYWTLDELSIDVEIYKTKKKFTKKVHPDFKPTRVTITIEVDD